MPAKGMRQKFMVLNENAFKDGEIELFGNEELYDSYDSAREDFTDSSTTTESYIICRVVPEKRLVRGSVIEEEINGN